MITEPIAKRSGKHLDWSVPQYCSLCKLQMRKKSDKTSDLVRYDGKGLCSRCSRTPEKVGLVAMVYDDLGQTCSRCRVYQPYSFFFPERGSMTGYGYNCKICSTTRKHGISRNTYLALLSAQGGSCAMCKIDATNFRVALSIDHDHTCCTGRYSCGKCVRGLLCDRCNRGLGLLRDSVDVLQSGIDYLLTSPTR